MTRLFAAMFLLSCTSGAMAQGKGGKVVFKGTADTTYNGNMIYLTGGPDKKTDSAVIKDGRFELKADFNEPTRYMLYSRYEAMKRGNFVPWAVLVTKPGELNVNAKPDSLNGSTVKGLPDNDLFREYNTVGYKKQLSLMDKLYAKFGKGTIDSLTPANPQYGEIVGEYQALSAAEQPAEQERLAAFIKKNPSSFASLVLLADAADNLGGSKAEALYNSLSSANRETGLGKSLANRFAAAKATAVGQMAPEFTQEDTLGKPVALKDFRGKYVLVDFWASWCGPCRAENPNVVKAFNEYKDKGFTVLGVSLDQPGAKDKWLAAIHKDNLTWTHVSDLKFWDNAAAKLYGVQAIPQNFLLDKEGKILAVNIRGEELSKKLGEVIK